MPRGKGYYIKRKLTDFNKKKKKDVPFWLPVPGLSRSRCSGPQGSQLLSPAAPGRLLMARRGHSTEQRPRWAPLPGHTQGPSSCAVPPAALAPAAFAGPQLPPVRRAQCHRGSAQGCRVCWCPPGLRAAAERPQEGGRHRGLDPAPRVCPCRANPGAQDGTCRAARRRCAWNPPQSAAAKAGVRGTPAPLHRLQPSAAPPARFGLRRWKILAREATGLTFS